MRGQLVNHSCYFLYYYVGNFHSNRLDLVMTDAYL